MTEEIKDKTIPEKYELNKDFKEKLKIFFMVARPSNAPMILTEKCIGIIAYRAEDALNRAINDFAPPGSNIGVISHGDFAYVDELIKKIQMEGQEVSVAEPAPIKEIKPEPIRTSKEQFIWNLKLACDEFIKDPEDRDKVREIINKINYFKEQDV